MSAKKVGAKKRGRRSKLATSTKRIAPGITRFDIEERRTHGFMARTARQGKRYQKFFSDMKYGGKKKAIAAAMNQLTLWSKELPVRHSNRDRLTSRNQTGRVGVYLAVSQDTAGQSHQAYCASWTDADGRRRKINFSLQRYGRKKAWLLACLAREKMSADRSRLMRLLGKQNVSKQSRKDK